MENFDLKKFLVENKLTTNSKLIRENAVTLVTDDEWEYDFAHFEDSSEGVKVSYPDSDTEEMEYQYTVPGTVDSLIAKLISTGAVEDDGDGSFYATDEEAIVDALESMQEGGVKANSRLVKEYIESDPETITEAFQKAGVDLSAPTEMEAYYGHDGEEKAFATGQEALTYLEGLRAEAEAEDPNFNTESGIAYDYGENVADLYEGDRTPKLLVSFGDTALYVIAQ